VLGTDPLDIGATEGTALKSTRAAPRLTRRSYGKNFMKPIPNGAQGQYVLRVEPAHLANRFKDSILPPVFSTPYLILIMENAALNAIRQYLEADESAVGTRVDVRHLVATPVGREVAGHAEVTGTEGRKIFFRVWAMDGNEEIGTGTHERTVVNISRIIERMNAKYGPTSGN